MAEYLDVIRPLTDPPSHGGDPADAFDVVVPSLPGFGFSGPVPDAGWDTDRIARSWAELMNRLSYHRYGSPAGQLAWILDKFREWTYPARRCPTPSSAATGSSPT